MLTVNKRQDRTMKRVERIQDTLVMYSDHGVMKFIAAGVWKDDGTMHRMLAFDFAEDEVARNVVYEEGEYAITKLVWSEEKQKLDGKETVGTYRGMVKDREFQVVVIRP